MTTASEVLLCQLDLDRLLTAILRTPNVPKGLKNVAEDVIGRTQDIIDQERMMNKYEQ